LDKKELRGELLWTNAEEFIEYLDTAAAPPDDASTPRPHLDRLRRIQANKCDPPTQVGRREVWPTRPAG